MVGQCPVGELQSSLDALAAEDLTLMFGPQVLDRLGELLVVQNRLAAEVACTVRECELTGAAEHDGLKTTVAWLRGPGHLAAGEAARLFWAGRALEHQAPRSSSARPCPEAPVEGARHGSSWAVVALIDAGAPGSTGYRPCSRHPSPPPATSP